jgi:flagella basal body P-ring formation protein FlgA
MIWTPRRWIPVMGLLLAGALPADAQPRGPESAVDDAPAVAASTAAAVAAAVAERWAVDSAVIRLEWGAGPALPEGRIRLLGSGATGSFVAEVTGADEVKRRRVRAGVRREVAVAARDLPRGVTLAAGDIALRDTLVWRPGEDPSVEAGWVTARRIRAGATLARPAVAPPAAVVAGRPVTLVWRSGELEVTTRAVAAGTAAVGARVAVRTESGRRLWGVAVSPDRVRIGGSQQ